MLSRAVAAAYKTAGPEWDQQEGIESESDGDEEVRHGFLSRELPGSDEGATKRKNQLEIGGWRSRWARAWAAAAGSLLGFPGPAHLRGPRRASQAPKPPSR